MYGRSNRFLMVLNHPCIWTEDDVVVTEFDPNCGVKGKRSSDYPCDGFDPGPMALSANCDTDGHYLCSECSLMSLRAREERSDPERDLRPGWTRYHDTFFYRQDRYVAAVQGFRRGRVQEWTVILVKEETSFHRFATEAEAFDFAESELSR